MSRLLENAKIEKKNVAMFEAATWNVCVVPCRVQRVRNNRRSEFRGSARLDTSSGGEGLWSLNVLAGSRAFQQECTTLRRGLCSDRSIWNWVFGIIPSEYSEYFRNSFPQEYLLMYLEYFGKCSEHFIPYFFFFL